MNILIIGGLGYIGSDLCDKLKGTNAVDVLDTDLYDSVYAETMSPCELLEGGIHNFKQGEKEYGCIIVCSDIDVEMFYGEDIYEDYLFKYIKGLKALNKRNPNAEIIYITSEESKVSSNQARYRKQFLIQFKKHKNFTVIESPSLYGDNVVVRSDTFINKIIHDFICYESYMLATNPFEIIKFQHIFQFTEAVCNSIGKDKTYFNKPDSLPAISLVNAVNWCIVESGAKYSIAVQNTVANIADIETGCSHLADPKAFKQNINMMINALNQRLSVEIFKLKSNRNSVLESAFLGKNINDKFHT